MPATKGGTEYSRNSASEMPRSVSPRGRTAQKIAQRHGHEVDQHLGQEHHGGRDQHGGPDLLAHRLAGLDHRAAEVESGQAADHVGILRIGHDGPALPRQSGAKLLAAGLYQASQFSATRPTVLSSASRATSVASGSPTRRRRARAPTSFSRSVESPKSLSVRKGHRPMRENPNALQQFAPRTLGRRESDRRATSPGVSAGSRETRRASAPPEPPGGLDGRRLGLAGVLRIGIDERLGHHAVQARIAPIFSRRFAPLESRIAMAGSAPCSPVSSH